MLNKRAEHFTSSSAAASARAFLLADLSPCLRMAASTSRFRRSSLQTESGPTDGSLLVTIHALWPSLDRCQMCGARMIAMDAVQWSQGFRPLYHTNNSA